MTFSEWYAEHKAEVFRDKMTYYHASEQIWQAATAAERERCAKIADDYGRDPDLHKTYPCETADEIAASIRAGEEPK